MPRTRSASGEMTYRAEFEWWKMEADQQGKIPLGKEPKGPFWVEVFNSGTASQPQWRSRLLPTHEEFPGRFRKTVLEAQESIAQAFRNQISKWESHLIKDIQQTSLISKAAMRDSTYDEA